MIEIAAIQNGEPVGTGAYTRSRIVIGSDHVDLRIQLPEVAPQHVVVWLEGSECFAEPMEGRTLVNEMPLVSRQALTPGDVLRICPQMELKVRFAQEKQGPAARKTEISFKAFTDVAGSSEDARPALSSSRTTASVPRPQVQQQPGKPEHDNFSPASLLKAGLLLFGSLAVVVWWILPIAFKMFGIKLPWGP